MGAREDIDLGDRDGGDHDATEVQRRVVDVWHPSFNQAKPATLPASATEFGRAMAAQAIEAARQAAAKRLPDAKRQELRNLTCWRSTPELYRRMVVHVAGLPREVVGKLDRDLTENEKVMLRAAIADLRMVLAGIAEL